eukprot:gene2289-2977_t
MLIQEDLKSCKTSLREVLAAGEPLNPEVIEQVEKAWGLTIRDFYGQTETTTQVGNPPGQPIKPGSMGRPLPGYKIRLLDADDKDAEEGEICIDLAHRPAALMQGYQQDDGSIAPLTGAVYRTGDVASRDADGYLTYVGRADDVFKAAGYRIGPGEIENCLVKHPAVANAAVVPKPDRERGALVKAYVVLAAGFEASDALITVLQAHVKGKLAPYEYPKEIEFIDSLPMTTTGKFLVRALALTVPGSAAVPRPGFAGSPPLCRCAGDTGHRRPRWCAKTLGNAECITVQAAR